MSRKVYRALIVLHASCALLLAASPNAFAGPAGARDDFDRWIPSIGLVVGFSTEGVSGALTAAEEFPFFGNLFDRPIDDRAFNSSTTLLPTASASQFLGDHQTNLTTLDVGVSFELQTPQLGRSKWSPRIFVGGDILNVSSQKRRVAGEGNPGKLVEPERNAAILPQDHRFPDETVTGQGSQASIDSKNVLYTARIGISIPFQIGDWRISIKPSAQYLNREFQFTGSLLDAQRDFPLNLPPTRNIVLFGDDKLDVHAIGPGLEIEIDAARVGSFVGSVFIGGGAYRVISDRTVAFSARGKGVFDQIDPAPDTLTTNFFRVNWNTEIEEWIYRGNIGFRIKWLGISGGWFGQGG